MGSAGIHFVPRRVLKMSTALTVVNLTRHFFSSMLKACWRRRVLQRCWCAHEAQGGNPLDNLYVLHEGVGCLTNLRIHVNRKELCIHLVALSATASNFFPHFSIEFTILCPLASLSRVNHTATVNHLCLLWPKKQPRSH